MFGSSHLRDRCGVGSGTVGGRAARRGAQWVGLVPLEPRVLLDGAFAGHDVAATLDGDADATATVTYHKMIVAGISPDSPEGRVDANTADSPFAGVGSLFLRKGNGPVGYICTATAIDALHVLTASHCLDTNDDGAVDFKPQHVTFQVNAGDLSTTITAAALHIHPDYTGFNKPSVNDDIAVIRLASPLPDGVPIYELHRTRLDDSDRATTLELVGYGVSGDGVNGYQGSASLSVKRWGANVVDAFELDDEGRLDDKGNDINEVYRADFDGPTGDGLLGGPTLGNHIETTLGGGDSGGPGFINISANVNDTDYVKRADDFELAAVNTFTFSGGGFASAPLFGSGLGGILVHPYLGWIDGITSGGGGDGGGDGGGGGGGNGKGNGKGPKTTLITTFAGNTAAAVAAAFGPSAGHSPVFASIDLHSSDDAPPFTWLQQTD